MNRLLLILLLFVGFLKIVAQEKYPTETENDLYWQVERKINFSDYQSKTDTNCIKFNEKYGLQMSSNIGFRGVVDITQKRGKIDKGYIVPVFCKNCSCILSEDSMGLLVDRLLFDMAELCARNVRKDLDNFQKTGNIDNPNAMFFTTVKNKWDEKMRSFFGSVLREVFIEKQDSAYIKWRQTTDELLIETEFYATKPEDCFRFVLGKPIEKGYKQAKTIMGDMRRNEN